jgi:hypothetical protein
MDIPRIPGFTAEASLRKLPTRHRDATWTRPKAAGQIEPSMKSRCYWDSEDVYCCEFADADGWGGCCSVPRHPEQGIGCVYRAWGST